MATFKNLIDNLNGSLAADAQDRNSLRNNFLRGEIPEEDHFHSAINSSLNLIDDGLFKTTDSPLCIKAASGDTTRPVLHFYGDMDTEPAWQLGIEGGHLHFTAPTDGTPRLTINSNGNVGIGTTSTHKLTVEGTADIAKFKTSTASNSRISIENSVNTVNLGIGSISPTDGFAYLWSRNGKLFVGPDGSPHLTIRGDLGGNVGIGTTAPKSTMHVAGDIVLGLDETNKKFIMHTRTLSSGDFLQITSDNAAGAWDWGNGITLKRGGNVGIGTTSPAYKLDVAGSIHAKAISTVSLHLRHSTAVVGTEDDWKGHHEEYSFLECVGVGDSKDVNSISFGMSIDAPPKNNANPEARIHFKLNSLQDAGNHWGWIPDLTVMTLKGNGNVGIGTTSPTAKLDVNGVASIIGLKVDRGTTSHLNGDGTFYRYNGEVYITVDNHLYIRDMHDGGSKFHFSTDNSTAYKSSGAGSWEAYSDKRLKKNIRDFNDGLQKIRQITPKTFQFTGDGGMEKDLEQVGVIAQDIREVVPYTVSVRPGKMKDTDTENTDLLSFDPSALTYVLINAVKELDSEVAALKKENAAAEKAITALTKTVAVIKKEAAKS